MCPCNARGTGCTQMSAARVTDVRHLEVDQGRDLGRRRRSRFTRQERRPCRAPAARRRTAGCSPPTSRTLRGVDHAGRRLDEIEERRAPVVQHRDGAARRGVRSGDRVEVDAVDGGKRIVEGVPQTHVACRRPRRGTSRRGTRSATNRERCGPRPTPSRSTRTADGTRARIDRDHCGRRRPGANFA